MTWRETWVGRAEQLTAALGLEARTDVASDPFFGRGGKLLAVSQRDQRLKLEIVTPIGSDEQPTAIISLNYHQDHFAHIFGIATADGAVAHTACVGFGLERIALALYRRHGFDRATLVARGARGAWACEASRLGPRSRRLRAASPALRRTRVARVELLRGPLGGTAPRRGRRAAGGDALCPRDRRRGRPVDVLQVSRWPTSRRSTA